MGYAGSIDEEIAARIRAAVDAAGVSDRSVFMAAGVPDGTWHRVIRVGTGGFRAAQLVRIAAALHIAPSELLPAYKPELVDA